MCLPRRRVGRFVFFGHFVGSNPVSLFVRFFPIGFVNTAILVCSLTLGFGPHDVLSFSFGSTSCSRASIQLVGFIYCWLSLRFVCSCPAVRLLHQEHPFDQQTPGAPGEDAHHSVLSPAAPVPVLGPNSEMQPTAHSHKSTQARACCSKAHRLFRSMSAWTGWFAAFG